MNIVQVIPSKQRLLQNSIQELRLRTYDKYLDFQKDKFLQLANWTTVEKIVGIDKIRQQLSQTSSNPTSSNQRSSMVNRASSSRQRVS